MKQAFKVGHNESVESLALWAFVKHLPIYDGKGSQDFARSLRRRFALLGALLALTLALSLWDWTGSLVGGGGVAAISLCGLWLYSEHGQRPAA